MSLLHIGDIVSLYSDGFLSTLGLVDDRCVLRPTSDHCPKKFRDCLFKVCIQYKYDIQKGLWDSSPEYDDALYKKLYAAAISEQDLNQKNNQKGRGRVIKYEDTIQLLHIKSNKFITVNPSQEALEDRDSTRVYLDLNGNEGSWFKVRSPYKYRSNGEDVVCESITLVSDSLQIRGHEKPLCLHKSHLCLIDHPDCLEINASRQESQWEVKLFLDYIEDVEDFLKGGDVVRLFHTGQDKFLTLDTYEQTEHVFLRHTDREKATTATSSKALWEVEVVHQDPCRSSLARWNSLIRLKHLATERFLAADQDDDDETYDATREKLKQKSAPVYKLISIEYSYDFATLFEFDSTNSNVDHDDCIPIHSNVSLKHHPTGTFVHSTSIIIDQKVPLDKGKSCMSKLGCAHNKSLDEVFLVSSVLATEVRDLDFINDACIILNEALEAIREGSEEKRDEAMRKLRELLPEIVYFIANKKEKPEMDKSLKMLVESPNRERQKLLREQNVLKLLFDILEFYRHDEFRVSSIICCLCYRVISLSFKGYRKNQEYILKWRENMQKQFGMDILAESTYSALFHSNKGLIEKQVTKQDVKMFTDLIRRRRRSEYLDCLADLCITDKNFVCPKNQEFICDLILNESDEDILIKTCTQGPGNHSILLSTKHWKLTCFEANDQDCDHDHQKQLEQADELKQQQKQKQQQQQPKNRMIQIEYPVDIEFVTKPLVEIVIGATNRYRFDMYILDYYRHQLDLFSAICRDSQYVANNKSQFVAKQLNVQLMQDCMSDDKLPSELRASFCRLLLHLHIIKEPQKYVEPVELRRSWPKIPEQVNIDSYNSYNNNREVQVARQGVFKETLQFVESYLQNLTNTIYKSSIFANSFRDMLTYEVINLNRQLTYFGFYKLDNFLRLSRMLLLVLEDMKNQQLLVMKTKTKIIETLHYIGEVQLDYTITSLLSLFKQNYQKQAAGLLLNPDQNDHHNGILKRRLSGLTGGEKPIDLVKSLGLPNSAHTLAKKTNEALNQRIQEINLDCNQGKKYVDVLLQLVKHDCPELVSASLKLLLNYRLLRNRILERFKRVELIGASPQACEDFRKIHPLIERTDKHQRRGQDDNHAFVSQVLLENPQLISYIVQHIQYLLKNQDDESFTRDLLFLLRELIPFDEFTGLASQRGLPATPLGSTSSSNGSSPTSGAATAAPTSSASHPNNTGNGGGIGQQQPDSLLAGLGTGSQNNLGGTQNAPGGGLSGATNAKQQAATLSEIQARLDAHGVSNLVIELIAMGSSKNDQKISKCSAAIFKDTLALGIALLEGGNPLVQASINDRLTKKGEKSERFFQVISDRIEVAQQALSLKQLSPTQSSDIRIMQPVLRLLQLLCEDHNLNMQRYMHSQKNNNSFNIVAKTLVFLNCICGSKEGSLGYKLGEYIVESNVDLINQTLRTLTEYCQGPCIENQRCILMHESNGIDMIRSLILDKIEPLDSLRMDRVLELKDNASKLLLALMESCSDPLHAQRILREPSLTRKLMNLAIAYYHEQDDYDDIFAEFSCEEMISSTDGMVRPRDVGHKVYTLCLQLVQQFNLGSTLTSSSGVASGVGVSNPVIGNNNLIGGGGVGASPIRHQHQQQHHHLHSGLSGAGGGGGASQAHLAKMPTSEEATLMAERCEPSRRDWFLREAAALRYYESNTAQIEIVRSDRQIERVVFPVPQICEYLTLETKRSVYHDTEPDEHDSKIPNFFQNIDTLFNEMKWQRELHTKPILHSIARHMSLCSSLEFRLSCLITMLVLVCVSPSVTHNNSVSPDDHATSSLNNNIDGIVASEDGSKVFVDAASGASDQAASNALRWASSLLAIVAPSLFVFKSYFSKLQIPYSWTVVLFSLTILHGELFGRCITLVILGLILELISLLHLSSVLINKGIINKPLHHIVFEQDVLYHGGHLLICTLGLFISPLFYPFWLPVSLIRREETLRNVIQAVTKNVYSILMVGFLGLIIILDYTIINYLLLGHDLVIELDDGATYKPCLGTLGECFIAHVNYGLRSGGGVGERIRDTPLDFSAFSAYKLTSIVTFFLVVNTMILQMVFGIVIDTFAALRDEKQIREKTLRDTCFVCGLDRIVFENHTPTFEDHIRYEHNLWHYLYFIVLIKTKSRTELNGPESFVYEMLENNDHSWFPRKRALSLKLD